MFVATTGSRDWVEPLLDHHFGPSTFELTVTGSEVSKLKPHPAAYLEVLRCSGLQPPGVVAVEDSANGLMAAQSTGLSCLVVTNDYTADDDLDSADLIVDGFGPSAKSRGISCTAAGGLGHRGHLGSTGYVTSALLIVVQHERPMSPLQSGGRYEVRQGAEHQVSVGEVSAYTAESRGTNRAVG